MQKMRAFTVGIGALALVASAAAQFDGPAPLAWRWVQPTSVAPGGSPLVNGETIYQSVGGRVYCIDKTTGNKRWQYPQLDPIPGIFRSAPMLAGDTLIVVGDNKFVYAIDAATGAPKWSIPLATGTYGTPTLVGNNLVLAFSDNTLMAYNTADGSPVWQNSYKVLEGIQGSLTGYGNDVIYFTNAGEIRAVNVATQRTDWRLRLNQVNPNPQAVVSGETVYLNSGSYLIALNASTGTPRWQAPAPFQLTSAPAVGQNGVMVLSTDGKAMVYDLASHQAVNKKPIDLGSYPLVAPAAVGSKFIVPTTNGALNLIDPTQADPLWVYVMRPLPGATAATPSNNTPGSGPGAPGRGFGGGGSSQTTEQKLTSVQAAAPAVLSGQTLLVTARDGSIFAFDKDLGVDLTPPKVEMLFPSAGDQVSGQPPLFLYFRITDEASGLKTDSLKIELNGQVMDYKLNRDGTVFVQFTMTGKNKPLTDGRKEIVVTATDWMGNVAKKSFSLNIDNTLPPIKLSNQDSTNQGGPGNKGGGRGGRGGGADG